MVNFSKDYYEHKPFFDKETIKGKILKAVIGVKNLAKPKRKPVYRNREFAIVFKKKYIKNYLMVVKGWKTYAEVSKYYGKTRQYMNMLDNQVTPASSEIIATTAYLIGSINGNWQGPFEIICTGEAESLNHPKYNLDKMNGIVPYDSYSIAYETRKNDLPVEKEEK